MVVPKLVITWHELLENRSLNEDVAWNSDHNILIQTEESVACTDFLIPLLVIWTRKESDILILRITLSEKCEVELNN